MTIREATTQERMVLFREAYKVWSKNRTFEQYCADNGKEDAYGTRYVMEQDGKILSSLILLRLKELWGYRVYGFGSVLTMEEFRGKGYATALLKYCIDSIRNEEENYMVFLYSEIPPAFYERLGFRVLPPYLQHKSSARCMVLCSEDIWMRLNRIKRASIPAYF